MRPKKIYMLICVVIFCFLLCGLKVSAAELNEQEVFDYSMSLFNWDSINTLQEELKSALPEGSTFNLQDEVTKLLSGEEHFDLNYILKMLGDMLFNELGLFIKLGTRFVLIVLLCNLLQALSSSFKSKETTKICFFVCYLIIIYSVIQSFVVMVELALHTIDYMRDVMLVCIPTLLAFMTTMGYMTSSSAMAPIIMSAIYLVTGIIQNIVLPCIISVMLLEILSTMSESFKIDKMIKLFYRGIKWGLGSIFTISLSLLGVYRMTLPYLDVTVKKAALKLTTAFVPVFGNAANGALEFITACSALVKNTFSISIIIWLVILASVPLIKVLAYTLIYQFAGAVIEPIGDKKMANIATKLSKGCEFIMSAVGIVMLLCIAVLMICMSVGTQVG